MKYGQCFCNKNLLKVFLIIILTSNIISLKAIDKIDSLVMENTKALYQGFNSLNLNQMRDAIKALEELPSYYSKNWLSNYYISYGYYMCAIYYLDHNKDNYIEQMLNKAIKQIDTSIILNNEFADSYILKVNILKLQIAASAPKMTEGIDEIKEIMNKAKNLEPDNPRIYLSEGLNFYFTPTFYGGNMDSAKIYLKKSDSLFMKYKPKSPLYANWGHEEVFAWLGQIAQKEKDLKLAKDYYEKALQINKNYNWVKKKLLPELNKTPQNKEYLNKSLIVILSSIIIIIIIILFIFRLFYNKLTK